MGRVKKVDLYENGTIAIVEAVSPELGNRVQRVRVQLPGTSAELLSKFREKNIDFAAHTNTGRLRCIPQPPRQPRLPPPSRRRSVPPDPPQPGRRRQHARRHGRPWWSEPHGVWQV